MYSCLHKKYNENIITYIIDNMNITHFCIINICISILYDNPSETYDSHIATIYMYNYSPLNPRLLRNKFYHQSFADERIKAERG